MKHRTSFLIATLVLLAPTVASAQGTYQDDEGFFVFLDAAFSTPRDADQVVGYAQDMVTTQVTTPLVVDWGGSVAGRAGFGYRWGANKVSVSYWQFDDDEQLAANGPAGGFINFAVGPMTYLYGYVYYSFGVPGSVDFTTQIQASAVDVEWGREQWLDDYVMLEWSLGLRYARFEENYDGAYDVCATTGCDLPGLLPGDVSFDVAKSNEGKMAGIRVGARARYFFTDTLAVTSGLAFSALEGEVDSRSGLTPTGAVNGTDPATLARLKDDGRSGDILELDLGLDWYLVDGRLRLSAAYQHSRWDGVPTDPLRNTPGILTANKDRDSVTFSGFKLGVLFEF